MFGLLSSIYNFYSEQADLRSWQSLPAQIRVARLFLRPGHRHLLLEDRGEAGELLGTRDLGEVDLKAKEARFVVTRASR